MKLNELKNMKTKYADFPTKFKAVWNSKEMAGEWEARSEEKDAKDAARMAHWVNSLKTDKVLGDLSKYSIKFNRAHRPFTTKLGKAGKRVQEWADIYEEGSSDPCMTITRYNITDNYRSTILGKKDMNGQRQVLCSGDWSHDVKNFFKNGGTQAKAAPAEKSAE